MTENVFPTGATTRGLEFCDTCSHDLADHDESDDYLDAWPCFYPSCECTVFVFEDSGQADDVLDLPREETDYD